MHCNKIPRAQGLIVTDRKIKDFGGNLFVNSTDKEIATIISGALGCINNAKFKFKTQQSQVYKRNSINLNCARHTKIFDENNIIPEFCFGCFKVQVEVNDLLSLVRLTKLFYDLNFEKDLTRKTMIEMRPEIPGFYKGLFYCRGLNQAHKLKEKLDPRKYNGAIFLGLNGPVVKSHGGTDAFGFYHSIDLCYKIIKGDLMNEIKKNLKHSKSVKE